MVDQKTGGSIVFIACLSPKFLNGQLTIECTLTTISSDIWSYCQLSSTSNRLQCLQIFFTSYEIMSCS